MNPIYVVMESPHRWLILAGVSFVAGTFGAIEMLALVLPHVIARVWLLALLALTLYFVVRALLDWKQRVLVESGMSPNGDALSEAPVREGSRPVGDPQP